MGYREYDPISARYQVPIVVTGFEPIDILHGTLMTMQQLEQGRAVVENQYSRILDRDGNLPAQKLMHRVFEVGDRKWRGIGNIPMSGYHLRDEFARHDAEKLFDVAEIATLEPEICISGQILRGIKKPARLPGLRHPVHARSARWGQPWFRPRARVPRTTPMDGICEPGRCRLSWHTQRRFGARGTPLTDGDLYQGSGPAQGEKPVSFGSCPLPISFHKHIVLGHGSGGKLSAELIEKIFLPAFDNPVLDKLDDQAVLKIGSARLAFTTDSFVVTPIFFPAATSASSPSMARSMIWP